MLVYLLEALVLSIASYCIYQLYLSPLSHIPGPKLAALTEWYAGYHDLIRGGQYIFVVENLHKIYGPVIRIMPNLVHVDDARFIDKLYTLDPRQKRERFWTVTNPLFADGSMLAAKDHNLHRQRRASLYHFFSKANIRRLEEDISSTLKHLLRRFDGWANTGPIAVISPFRAATKDIIQAYVFGGGQRYLDLEDCNDAFFAATGPGPLTKVGVHLHTLFLLLQYLPPKILFALVPQVVVFANWVDGLGHQIDKIRESHEEPERRTVFHELLQNDSLPASEKTTKRLREEGMVIVNAGSGTTAWTLGALLFRVLSDKTKVARLRAELASAIKSEIPAASEIEHLLYLNALITETIRLHPGAVHRQDRVAPDEDLIYESPETKTAIKIPAGTGIGMAASIVNRDKRIYGPDADEFVPERWLSSDSADMKKHILTFSKGGKQCLGQNLATLELQMFTAAIFHKYDVYDPDKGENQGRPTLELHETTVSDVTFSAEYIEPAFPNGNMGARLLIRH